LRIGILLQELHVPRLRMLYLAFPRMNICVYSITDCVNFSAYTATTFDGGGIIMEHWWNYNDSGNQSIRTRNCHTLTLSTI